MANKTIDQLTAAGALAGTEEVPIWQSAATVKTTIADIAKTPGVGTATQIAYFGASGELTGDAALTFDSGTGTLAAAVVQVGSTPFTFSESSGVLQLGDSALTFDSFLKQLTVSPNVTGGGTFLVAGEAFDGTPGDPAAPLTVVCNPAISDYAVYFRNQDTTGNHDFVQTMYQCYEAALVGPKGILEFQASGNGDGSCWFGFNFLGSGNADLVQINSTGSITPGVGASDNAIDLGTLDLMGFGIARTFRTGYFGTSVVSPLFDGAVKFPTSDPMIAGAWWNNAGTLTISAA